MRGVIGILFRFLLSFQPCRDGILALWNYEMMELWHLEYFKKLNIMNLQKQMYPHIVKTSNRGKIFILFLS